VTPATAFRETRMTHSPTGVAAPVAIVTGAGSGIGRAAALRLAAAGFRLLLVGRTLRKLEASADEIARGHPGAAVDLLEADLGDPAAPAGAVARAMARFGRLDAIVNAAGVAPLAPIERTDLSLLESTFATNTFGPALLMAAAWPALRASGGGCIVNVSTIGTTDPFPGFFAYAASKSALDSLTRSAAREGARLGIRAFAVNPGAVETPLLRSNFPEKAIPRERALSPEQVAEVITDCIEGRRPQDLGHCIPLPSP
jgi:NAD(P)-dependent dehydrogenase (short-subunit alcohol dehydrogenase family)